MAQVNHWPSDEESAALLLPLLERGMTASQIGVELSRSRCSVIGKCRRLGLSHLNKNRGGANGTSFKPRPVADVPCEIGRVPLLNLSFGQCRWTDGMGAASSFLFCGAVCRGGSSLCSEHHMLAYVSSSDSRRRLAFIEKAARA